MNEVVKLPKNISVKFKLPNKEGSYAIPLVGKESFPIHTEKFGLRYLATIIEYNKSRIKIFSPDLKNKMKILSDRPGEVNFSSNEHFYYFDIELEEMLDNGIFIIKNPLEYKKDQRRKHVRAYVKIDVQILSINNKDVNDVAPIYAKDISASGMKLCSAMDILDVKSIKFLNHEILEKPSVLKISFNFENQDMVFEAEVMWSHRLGNAYEHGVRFMDVPNHIQDIIMKKVFEIELERRKKD